MSRDGVVLLGRAEHSKLSGWRLFERIHEFIPDDTHVHLCEP